MTTTAVPSGGVQPVTSNKRNARQGEPNCYAVTVFTQCWKEVRDFYVTILGARIVRERPSEKCELEIGGVPLCLRNCETGEAVSYFHLYLTLKNPDPILKELRKRGVIVTTVGPFLNFRDPEGRMIKLSQKRAVLA
jgi:catechol 2,3-dioxygenase-like lactoylglutathione lyase family enzyme